jgi:TPR repeat protein
MRWVSAIVRAVSLSSVIAVSGCVGAALEGANIAKDKAVLAKNIEAARAGDIEAQYRVGNALCCSLNEGKGFYNTQKSVEWLCRAARRNHGPSAQKIGEIYTGNVVSGVRVLRRVAQRVVGSSTNDAVAYAWLDRAATNGVADARIQANELWRAMTDPERAQADAYVRSRAAPPCNWPDVIKRT